MFDKFKASQITRSQQMQLKGGHENPYKTAKCKDEAVPAPAPTPTSSCGGWDWDMREGDDEEILE